MFRKDATAACRVRALATTCNAGQLQRLFTERLGAFRQALAESVGRDWPTLWSGALTSTLEMLRYVEMF